MTETRLAPGLLLAMPQLVDPNFSRAVVLMIEHNDEGSFGLIINHPSDMEASALLSAMDIPWHGAEAERVWAGGPVQPTTGWLLHGSTPRVHAGEIELGDGQTVALVPGLELSTSPSSLRAIAAEPPLHVRLLLGYSGWGPGQLASEMARGSWLHAEATPSLVFDTPAEHMWTAALGSIGVNPETIVPSHGVH